MRYRPGGNTPVGTKGQTEVGIKSITIMLLD